MEQQEFINLKEASSILKVQERSVMTLIKGNTIDFIYNSQKDEYYISKIEIGRLINNQKRNIPLSEKVPDGYITIREVEEELNISNRQVRYFVRYNSVTSIKIRGIVLVKLDELIKYHNELLIANEKISELSTNCDWNKIGMLYRETQDKIRSLIQEKKVDDTQVRIVYYGKFKTIFVHKDLIRRLEVDKVSVDYKKYQISRVTKTINTDIKVKDVYNFKEIEKATLMLMNEEIEVKNKKIYSLFEIERQTGITYSEIISEVNSGKLSKNFILNFTDMNETEYNVFESGVRKLLRIRGLISAQEVSAITGIHQTVLVRSINNSMDKNKINKIYFQNHTYLKVNEMLEVIKKYISKKVSRESSYEEILNVNINQINTSYVKTLDLAETFLKEEISQLKSKSNAKHKKHEFGRAVNAIKNLFSYFNKEIFLYNNYEIDSILLEEGIGSSHMHKVTKFINFVKKELGDKCNYNHKVTPTYVEQLRSKNNSGEDKIYSEKEWVDYYCFLSNTDLHILKSFEDSRYAQIWLYCILHLSITWRSTDIIEKVPNIPLEVINVYDFNWFKRENEFTLSMALKILEHIRFSIDSVIAYKNKMNLHFNIPVSLKIPTAVALVINEIHRRNENKECIFYRLKSSPPTKAKDYSKFFKSSKNLIAFSNIKATRTLMTYNQATANNIVGRAGVAYQLNSYARSHKQTDGKLSNTTSLYLHLNKVDGSPGDIARQTIERGSFGFMYVKLLNTCFKRELVESVSQEEMTSMIREMRDNINPVTLENICEHILNQSNKTDLGIEMMELKKIEKDISIEALDILTNTLENKIIEKYKEVAIEMFPSLGEDFLKFIQQKVTFISQIFDKEISGFEASLRILSDIRNGERNCFTDYSNCIFDEIERKEKCPYKLPGSCIGCNNNLQLIMQLYEVANRLNAILDEMKNNNNLSEIDLIRDTHVMQNYLSILIQFKTQYENADKKILSAFINEKEIKEKIIELQNNNKVLFKK